MKRVLKQTLEIAETSSDPRIKLEAMRIANDCYEHIMNLCTNAGIISDAMKYVTQKTEQLDTLKKLDGSSRSNHILSIKKAFLK